MGGLAPEFDIDLGIELAVADGHIACCSSEPPAFICGAPFHPECEVADAEPANCATCTKIHHRYVCVRGHHHCPLQPPHFPMCPPKENTP